MTNEERTKAGRELAAKLFAGVKRTNAGPLASPLREYTTRYLFGEVWQGKELSLEERSLITCATLIALNRTNEQQVHFQGFKNLGLPRAKLEAVITHLAHYAGWPCAASASHVLNEVWPAEQRPGEPRPAEKRPAE